MTEKQIAKIQDYFNKGTDLPGLQWYIYEMLVQEGNAQYEQGHADGMAGGWTGRPDTL